MYFAYNGSCSAHALSKPIYCPLVINPYTVSSLSGPHGHQIDEVLLYMAGEDAKPARLHAKARLSKTDCLWHMMYLHPENTLVHLSRRMLPYCPTLLLLWFDPPPPLAGALHCVPVVSLAPCLPSERSRDATGSQIACSVAKGIKTIGGKVEVDCCKPYAQLGFCPTITAVDI